MNLLREIFEGLKIALDAVRANKLRSALTTLGIVIGIVTVTLMGTAIEGINIAFKNSISTMGADVLFVTRFPWFNNSYSEWMRIRTRPEITTWQAEAVVKQMTLARAVAPVAVTMRGVKRKNRSSGGVRIIGTTEDFQVTSGITVAQGRFLSSSEVEGGRPVCVIGEAVATNLFKFESPIGEKLKVGDNTLEVVGVLERQGSFLGAFGLDNQIFVPVKLFMSSIQAFPYFEIQVKASSIAQLEEAKEELRGVMRKIRRVPPGAPDNFSINQQEMFIQTFGRVSGTIAAAGLFITGLSLFVGGIGIMNIMFVSVAERTREIGVRKAIGAKRRAILMQFLSEAASICLLGGLVGLAIAWGLTFAIAKLLPVTMSLKVVFLAILVSLITGVVSGFLPAWRAARMNPVDALRNE
ncbi:MAG TPA: ABC transporter permease [Verrucomicrobiae bacterium]|nr:ABC transporter permease [Verrucomicrobiae bacterium]